MLASGGAWGARPARGGGADLGLGPARGWWTRGASREGVPEAEGPQHPCLVSAGLFSDLGERVLKVVGGLV